MTEFRRTGTLKVGANALADVRALFDAGRLDDEGTLAAIADCRRRFGETIDPHTAVGYRRGPAASPRSQGSHGRAGDGPSGQVPRRRREGDRRAAARCRPGWPTSWIAAERVDGLPNDIAALKTLIDERMASAREPAPGRAKVRT